MSVWLKRSDGRKQTVLSCRLPGRIVSSELLSFCKLSLLQLKGCCFHVACFVLSSSAERMQNTAELKAPGSHVWEKQLPLTAVATSCPPALFYLLCPAESMLRRQSMLRATVFK